MPRILLIDDDDSLRTFLSHMLGQIGHTVIEARNGAEGLALFQSAGADIVMTDLVMPEKEGFEVLMALRKQQPPVKIIAMTGDRGSFRARDNLHMAKSMGASQLLEKPFSHETLVAAIEAITHPSHSLPGHFGARRTDTNGASTRPSSAALVNTSAGSCMDDATPDRDFSRASLAHELRYPLPGDPSLNAAPASSERQAQNNACVEEQK